MPQLYRGELSRSDRWRTRLDTTTNWALTTTAAVVSFGFRSDSPHVTFLVGIWLVLTFLVIEARRYRYYDLWNRRVRLLEDGYWVPLLRREPPDPDALKELAAELERPQIQLSFASAVQTRLNRAYGSLLMLLFPAWFVKVYMQPYPAATMREFIERTHVGILSGWVVTGALAACTLGFFLMFLFSLVAKSPLGELRVRPRSRKVALWDSFLRPYAAAAPRRRPQNPTAVDKWV